MTFGEEWEISEVLEICLAPPAEESLDVGRAAAVGVEDHAGSDTE